MVAMLQECPNAVGFMGSDRYNELGEEVQAEVEFCPVVQTAIRFALATCVSKQEIVIEKIELGEPLVVATSYPRAASQALADIYGVKPEKTGEIVETVEFGGGLESKPVLIPRIDAFFDVVDSGRTLIANRCRILFDDLGRLTVGAVWRRQQRGYAIMDVNYGASKTAL